MKSSHLLSTLFFVTDGVLAHYKFDRVSRNGGELSKSWQYVRNITTGFAYFAKCDTCHDQLVPYYDIYDENFRCGRGAAVRGAEVETLSVNAGDGLEFWPSFHDDLIPIMHSGHGQAYLSKPPADLESYTGDGDWFKIGFIGARDDKNWTLYMADSMNFTIPPTTPPGKYLMRVEHSLPMMEFNATQWYISCAHIEVKGPGGGTPGPMVKFPGAYDVWDAEYWAPYWVYGGVNLTMFTPPGPPVWKG